MAPAVRSLRRGALCGLAGVALACLAAYAATPAAASVLSTPAPPPAMAPGNASASPYGLPLSLESLHSTFAYAPEAKASTQEENMAEILKFVEFRNGLVLWALPEAWVARMGHFSKAWAANFALGCAQYVATTVPWSLYIYVLARGKHVPVENIPSLSAIAKQAWVSTQALPMYTALPALTEVFVRNGWTRAYGSVATVGWPMYFAYLALYMLSVEFGVYWMHRELHDIKFLYKALHHTHHVYNKEHTLSPFAGLAFNPLDGILQAVPYVWGLFLVPCHVITHEILLFGTALWTASIHDCIDGKCEPIMGAGYHTIHHTSYRHNYGHYTILFDWMFGTLISPEEYAAQAKRKAK